MSADDGRPAAPDGARGAGRRKAPPTIKQPRSPRAEPAEKAGAREPAAASGGEKTEGGPRKLIRPSLAEHGTALPEPPKRPRQVRSKQEPGRRRPDASDHGGAEVAWYARRMAQSTPVVISLERGEEVRGVLEWHDRDSVKLRRPDGLAVVVMKQAIVQAREEPAARHAERASRKAARTAPRTRRSKPREGSAGDDA